MRFAALATLALVSCSQPSCPAPGRGLHYTSHPRVEVNTIHIPVWVDRAIPDSFDESIWAAVNEWNYALNGHKRYEIRRAEDAGSLEWRLDNQAGLLYFAAARVRDADYPGDGILGWVDMTQKNTLHLLVDGLNVRPDEMRIVIMHEIGHAQGIEHLSSGLMAPFYNLQPPCIDYLTVQQLSASHQWDSRSLNWCE